MSETNLYQITGETRELFLKIFGSTKLGSPEFHRIGNRLHFLADHFPPSKINRALTWLVRHDCTGPKFLTWYVEEVKSSDLEMHRKLLVIVDNLAPQLAVVAGKNFRT